MLVEIVEYSNCRDIHVDKLDIQLGEANGGPKTNPQGAVNSSINDLHERLMEAGVSKTNPYELYNMLHKPFALYSSFLNFNKQMRADIAEREAIKYY